MEVEEGAAKNNFEWKKNNEHTKDSVVDIAMGRLGTAHDEKWVRYVMRNCSSWWCAILRKSGRERLRSTRLENAP